MIIEYKQTDIYQEDNLILDKIDFKVEESEFVYLIGKVGSGKSSLLKSTYCELDILPEDTEKAEVLGRDLTHIKRKEVPALRRDLGIIFQDFQLLHDRTVKRNLEFVLQATGWKDRKEREARIGEVLEAVGMTEKAEKKPHELSGGEQQRVAIARAILNQPKIIIADEPTGNLDPETATSIVALLRDITKTGTAVVMSTHNVGLIQQYPGVVYLCHDGHLEEVTHHYSQITLDDNA